VTAATLAAGTGCACVTIGAAAGTLLAAWAFIALGAPASLQRSRGQPRPEGRLGGYDAWDVEDFLRRAGPGSRAMFRRALLLHIAFAVVAGVGVSLVLAGTWGRVLGPRHEGWEWLAIALSATAAVTAVAESVLLLVIMGSAQDGLTLPRREWVGWASRLSTAKWTLSAVSLLTVVAGAIVLAFAGTGRL